MDIENDTDEILTINETRKKKTTNKEPSSTAGKAIKGTAVLAILHAYLYFFGYSYFKAMMTSLGFEGAKIQGNIGEIYFQAYIGFGVSLAHVYHAMKGKLLESFLSYPVLYISLAICTATIIVYKENIRKFIKKRALKTIKRFIKNDSQWIKILKTILLSALFILTLAFAQPIILILAFIVISTIFLYLYIPLQAGEISAKEILQDTSCKKPEFISTEQPAKSHIISCSSIITKDKSYISGKFIYSDDLNYYFIVNNEIIGTPSAKVIPIESVKEFSSNIYINKSISPLGINNQGTTGAKSKI